jgi:retron-type reverse transcriptase
MNWLTFSITRSAAFCDLTKMLQSSAISQHSYGFISGRSQHQAVQMAQHIVSSGKPYVVDIDLRGVVTSSEEGAVQGSPLSPLLSNIVLDEVDQELEKRGLEFCRFADDR